MFLCGKIDDIEAESWKQHLDPKSRAERDDDRDKDCRTRRPESRSFIPIKSKLKSKKSRSRVSKSSYSAVNSALFLISEYTNEHFFHDSDTIDPSLLGVTDVVLLQMKQMDVIAKPIAFPQRNQNVTQVRILHACWVYFLNSNQTFSALNIVIPHNSSNSGWESVCMGTTRFIFSSSWPWQ
jgi:hypothetical protein